MRRLSLTCDIGQVTCFNTVFSSVLYVFHKWNNPTGVGSRVLPTFSEEVMHDTLAMHAK